MVDSSNSERDLTSCQSSPLLRILEKESLFCCSSASPPLLRIREKDLLTLSSSEPPSGERRILEKEEGPPRRMRLKEEGDLRMREKPAGARRMREKPAGALMMREKVLGPPPRRMREKDGAARFLRIRENSSRRTRSTGSSPADSASSDEPGASLGAAAAKHTANPVKCQEEFLELRQNASQKKSHLGRCRHGSGFFSSLSLVG